MAERSSPDRPPDAPVPPVQARPMAGFHGWWFSNVETGLELCELRGGLWRALHGDGSRDDAIALLRARPELAQGGFQEWADALQVLRAHLGPPAPLNTTLTPDDQAWVDRANADAMLGPRVVDVPPGIDPQLPLTSDGQGWTWAPKGHWLIDALLFGDQHEAQALLDAGLNPNVSIPGMLDSATQLNAWTYCLSLVLMDNAGLVDTGIAGTPASIRQAAGDLLERFLKAGLDPDTPVVIGGKPSGTRRDQVQRWVRNDPEWPWGRRWSQAIEQYALRQALPPIPCGPEGPKRPRL